MTIGNYFLYDLQKFRAILKGFTNIMVILEVIWEVVFVFLFFFGGGGDYFCHFGGFNDITITPDVLKLL